jgi:hypothetical protein
MIWERFSTFFHQRKNKAVPELNKFSRTPWRRMGGSGRIAPSLSVSSVDWGEWSASYPSHFTHGIHCTGGWMGPRTGLDAMENRILFQQLQSIKVSLFVILGNCGVPFFILFYFITKILIEQKQKTTRWKIINSKSYPCNRPWKPIGLWDVQASTFSRQSTHRWR